MIDDGTKLLGELHVDGPASRATELGGTLVVPPMDVQWSRMTVIGDPQGATFIASQFVPENKDIGG